LPPRVAFTPSDGKGVDQVAHCAQPRQVGNTPRQLGYFVGGALPPGYQFAGVGDFNGDGISDVLLWNSTVQNGLLLTLQGSSLRLIGQIQPFNTGTTWQFAGVADFDDNGVSDVLLRDSAGNLEILYMNTTGVASATDLTPSQLGFTATPAFKSDNPGLPTTGTFNTTWKVSGVGKINGYAGIIWTNALNEIGLTPATGVELAPSWQN
jgi:hypothetical protein